MSAVRITITIPVRDDHATQGKANEFCELVAARGFSEHLGMARARAVPYASNVTAEVVESRDRVPVERGAFA